MDTSGVPEAPGWDKYWIDLRQWFFGNNQISNIHVCGRYQGPRECCILQIPKMFAEMNQ